MNRLLKFIVLIPSITIGGCVTTAVQLDCLGERASFSKPIIRNSEFPIKLSYVSGGHLYEVSDTLSCKYKGLSCTYAGLKIDWDKELLSGNESLILKELKENSKLIKSLPSCDHFMSTNKPWASYSKNLGATLYKEIDGSRTWSAIKPEELLESYEIEVLSWDYSNPITQTQIVQVPNKALLSPLSRLGQSTLRSGCPKAWRYT